MNDSVGGGVQQGILLIALWVLAVLTWCPIGYGSYGAVSRMFAMPGWAAVALAIGAVLFLVEWFYLFHSGLALDDSKLFSILKEIQDDNIKSREVPS